MSEMVEYLRLISDNFFVSIALFFVAIAGVMITIKIIQWLFRAF